MSRSFCMVFLILNAGCLLASTVWFLSVSAKHFKAPECSRFMTVLAIFISLALLTMSLAGFYASFFKSDCFFRIYFFFMFLWIFSLTSTTVFLVVLSKQRDGMAFQDTQIKEYKLEEYSGWIRRLIIKEDEWYRIKNCFIKERVCGELKSNLNVSEFYKMNLTPVKSGCCKPPLGCGFKYVNATFWLKKPEPNVPNMDCQRWKNNQSKLCFDCDSCKAAVLANLKSSSPSVSSAAFELVTALLVGLIGWSAWMWSNQENQNQNQE